MFYYWLHKTSSMYLPNWSLATQLSAELGWVSTWIGDLKKTHRYCKKQWWWFSTGPKPQHGGMGHYAAQCKKPSTCLLAIIKNPIVLFIRGAFTSVSFANSNTGKLYSAHLHTALQFQTGYDILHFPFLIFVDRCYVMFNPRTCHV